MLLLALSAVNHRQYPIQWVIYVFQRVACELLPCIVCLLSNILTILTILTVKKTSSSRSGWQRPGGKEDFPVLLVPHFICGKGLPSGAHSEKEAQSAQVYVERLVQDLSSAGMCSAAFTH